MQDILLEPYGGQILHLTVGATTTLTALLAAGGLTGFGLAARLWAAAPIRIAWPAFGALVGLAAFSAVIFSGPLHRRCCSPRYGADRFRCRSVRPLHADGRDGMAPRGQIGLALGIWGAVQASAAGVGRRVGGLIRDGVSALASKARSARRWPIPPTGYTVVYHIEIACCSRP